MKITPRGRAFAVAGSLAAAATLTLAGCGSTTTGDSSNAAPTTATTTAAGSDASTGTGSSSQSPAEIVAAASALPSSYPIPTAAPGDPTALQGKTVYYIPVTLQAPRFGTVATALKSALTALGATEQVCDGGGTPTQINACITQATQGGAAAIIADAIPYGLGKNGFDAALAAHIPVVVTNQQKVDQPDSIFTIEAAGTAQELAMAAWTIQDSGGKAHVLFQESTDNEDPKRAYAASKALYDSQCPDCEVVANEMNSANFAQVAPSTIAALTNHPDINYVNVQFAQFLQPTTGGIQGAGDQGKVKVTDGSATASDLKAVKSGDLAATVGQATAFQGWIDADAALRLAGGDKTMPTYTDPYRLFTPDNIDSVDLDAADDSSWYGPATFPDDFKKLWGVK